MRSNLARPSRVSFEETDQKLKDMLENYSTFHPNECSEEEAYAFWKQQQLIRNNYGFEVGKYGVRRLAKRCPREYYNLHANPELAKHQKYYLDPEDYELFSQGEACENVLKEMVDTRTGEPFYSILQEETSFVFEEEDCGEIIITGKYDASRMVRNDLVIVEAKKSDRHLKRELEPHRLQVNFYVNTEDAAYGKLKYWIPVQPGSKDRIFQDFIIPRSEADFNIMLNRCVALHRALLAKSPPKCECRHGRLEQPHEKVF